MIILKEKHDLNEMAIRPISVKADALPFRIAIKAPDHLPPHAHVVDLKKGVTDLYQFLLTNTPPKTVKDIKDYKGELPDDQKQLICDWACKKSKLMPKFTNWEMLISQWMPNENEKW